MASQPWLGLSNTSLIRRLRASQAPTITRVCSSALRFLSTSNLSPQASSQPANSTTSGPTNISSLLSKPTWSIQSLIPPPQSPQDSPITPKQLRHLLRLSALPEPATAEEEASLLSTLSAQLHFVREIQSVDTTGVEPLRAIRDESVQAEMELEVTVESMSEALGREEHVGKHVKRVRRRSERDVIVEDAPTAWRPLDAAKRSVGGYFVVDGKSDGEGDRA